MYHVVCYMSQIYETSGLLSTFRVAQLHTEIPEANKTTKNVTLEDIAFTSDHKQSYIHHAVGSGMTSRYTSLCKHFRNICGVRFLLFLKEWSLVSRRTRWRRFRWTHVVDSRAVSPGVSMLKATHLCLPPHYPSTKSSTHSLNFHQQNLACHNVTYDVLALRSDWMLFKVLACRVRLIWINWRSGSKNRDWIRMIRVMLISCTWWG